MTAADIEALRHAAWDAKVAAYACEWSNLYASIHDCLYAAKSLLQAGSSMRVKWGPNEVTGETPPLPSAAKDPFRELTEIVRTQLRPGVKISVQWGVGFLPAPVAPPNPPIPPQYPLPPTCIPCIGQWDVA